MFCPNILEPPPKRFELEFELEEKLNCVLGVNVNDGNVVVDGNGDEKEELEKGKTDFVSGEVFACSLAGDAAFSPF